MKVLSTQFDFTHGEIAPTMINRGDLEAYKLARDVAAKIQNELNYPGEIKVTVIRETRVIEYAK